MYQEEIYSHGLSSPTWTLKHRMYPTASILSKNIFIRPQCDILNNNNMRTYKYLIVTIIMGLSFTSCNDFLDPDPTDRLSENYSGKMKSLPIFI